MSAFSCARKHAWPSFDLAEGHRLLLLQAGRAADPARLHSYHCPDCGSWHVGHGRAPRDLSRPEYGRADWTRPGRGC
jgi:hypothetical protein